ncbi:MAG TPA: hypothetical protein DEH22_13815 [Chloroflexi bacterium]|nr:hypothetical protein [Chloroflexota bacterium]
MTPKLPSGYRSKILLLLVLSLIILSAILPLGIARADANAPTETLTPEPTHTSAPPEATQVPTNAPAVATEAPLNPAFATPIPVPPTSILGGLSLLNRILLVILAVITVIVMGVIAYAIFDRTRREM